MSHLSLSFPSGKVAFRWQIARLLRGWCSRANFVLLLLFNSTPSNEAGSLFFLKNRRHQS